MGNPPGAAVATPPPAAAVPAAPDFAAGIEKTVNDFDAKAAAQQAKSDAEMAPLEASARQAAQALDTKANSPVETLPLPKNLAQHLDPKQLNEAASIWMTLGALGGLLSRQPMTAALGNMTAAMKGVHEGDAEQYDRATKEFNANFDKAMKANKALIDEKEKALKDTHLSLTARLELMRLASAKAGDQMGMVKGDFKSQMELHKARIDLYYKAEAAKRQVDSHNESIRMRRETLAQNERHFQQLHATPAAGALTPQQSLKVQMLADRYRAGDPGALTGIGLGKAAQPLRDAVLERAAQDMQRDGKTGADISANKMDFVSTQASMRSYQTYADRLEALGGKIDKDIKVLMDTAAKGVGPTSVPVFDKWIQGGRRGLGDPDVVAFDVAIQTVKNEYGRSMSGPASNAQLHVAAMDHADKLINDAQNVDQLKAAVGTMRKDIANGQQQAKETLASMRERTAAHTAHPPNANGKGWMLHTDAKGNRAYVSPDGKQFEEVK